MIAKRLPLLGLVVPLLALLATGCGDSSGTVPASPTTIPTPVQTQGMRVPQPVISVVPPLNSATAAVQATAVVQRNAIAQLTSVVEATNRAEMATVYIAQETAFAKRAPTMTAYALTGEQSKSPRAELGKSYPLHLYTHCGVDYQTDFDGSFWDAEDASYLPGTLGDPSQRGTMTLLGDNRARFDFEGGSILFVRHVGPKVINGCR